MSSEAEFYAWRLLDTYPPAQQLGPNERCALLALAHVHSQIRPNTPTPYKSYARLSLRELAIKMGPKVHRQTAFDAVETLERLGLLAHASTPDPHRPGPATNIYGFPGLDAWVESAREHAAHAQRDAAPASTAPDSAPPPAGTPAGELVGHTPTSQPRTAAKLSRQERPTPMAVQPELVGHTPTSQPRTAAGSAAPHLQAQPPYAADHQIPAYDARERGESRETTPLSPPPPRDPRGLTVSELVDNTVRPKRESFEDECRREMALGIGRTADFWPNNLTAQMEWQQGIASIAAELRSLGRGADVLPGALKRYREGQTVPYVKLATFASRLHQLVRPAPVTAAGSAPLHVGGATAPEPPTAAPSSPSPPATATAAELADRRDRMRRMTQPRLARHRDRHDGARAPASVAEWALCNEWWTDAELTAYGFLPPAPGMARVGDVHPSTTPSPTGGSTPATAPTPPATHAATQPALPVPLPISTEMLGPATSTQRASTHITA